MTRPFRRIVPPRTRATTNPAMLFRRDLGGDAKPLIWSIQGEPFAPDDRPDHHVYVRRDLARQWATRVQRRLWLVRLRERCDTTTSWLALGLGMAVGLALRALRPRERPSRRKA